MGSKKIIFAWSFVLVFFLYLFMMPNWLKYADIQSFKNWYPHFGCFVFVSVNYILPLCFLLGTLFFIRIYFKHLRWFFKEKVSKILTPIYRRSHNYLNENLLPNFNFTSSIFFSSTAVIYFIAFASVLWQFPLISETGLIPFKQFANLTFQHEGWISLFNFPSIFWISQTNVFLKGVLIFACLISLLALFTRKRTIYFVILWFLYLSIASFGRDLFQYPWDSFLLEMGFLSIIAIYYINRFNQLPRLIVLAFGILFFRQWFSMAMTKVLWSDSTWFDLTYMKYFWLNQPSPTAFSVKMYNLPMSIQKVITFITLIFEIGIPLLMFFGRRGRIFAFYMSLILSVMIQICGNYGFFNLITVVLGFWCLDDKFFKKSCSQEVFLQEVNFSFGKLISKGLIYIILIFNIFYVFLQFSKESNHPFNFTNYYFFAKQSPKEGFLNKSFFEAGKMISRFRIVAPHGVFKKIPKKRLNLQMQVKKEDGKWEDLTFNKGTSIMNYPFTAPVMHRLPFSFFYQSQGIPLFKYLKINTNRGYFEPWISNLIAGVFNGNKEIEKLVGCKNKGKVLEMRFLLNLCTPQNNEPFYTIKTIDTIKFEPLTKFKQPLVKIRKFKKLKIY
jgi:hypothetical protein